MNADDVYRLLVLSVNTHGERRKNRTGIDTISLFGAQARFDLTRGFPLLTTKKMQWKSIVLELLWFLRGETNIKTLGCGIWDSWAKENGDCGPIYGYQWRRWARYEENPYPEIPGREELLNNPIDQIANVISQIKSNPDSRRLIVTAWNPGDIDKMGLPPCHLLFQFNVVNGFLDCNLYQRSADLALGVPFNIASYALLMHLIADECNLTPRTFIHTFGDLHIYVNHIEGLKEQTTRIPYPEPLIEISRDKTKPIWETKPEDIKLTHYVHHPAIKFEVAV